MERRTRQRAAIEDAISAAGRPVGPREILLRARKSVRSLSLATVYRAVRALEEEGAIAAVVLPDEPPRYEPAEIAAEHHHHFRCDDCARVFDLPGCPGGFSDLLPEGFRMTRHDVVLYGRCPDCAVG